MKKYIYLMILLFANSFFLHSQSDMCEGFQTQVHSSFNLCSNNEWVMVFEDDFNSNSLDLSYWKPVTGVPRDLDFTKYKAWHKPENIVVQNGILKILSKQEQLSDMPVVKSWSPYIVEYHDFDYTTAEMWTNKKFTYGILEARIKINKGKGFKSAFWMWGDDPVYNELDVFEFEDNDTRDLNMNVYYDYNGDENNSNCQNDYNGIEDYANDYHIYTVVWEKSHIYWYVDGDEKRRYFKYHTLDGGDVDCQINAGVPYMLNTVFTRDPMSIILNCPVQNGQYTPDASTNFPGVMEVDWVRFYKRSSCDDINISNASDYPLNERLYNTIIGKNITFDCSYTVPTNYHLEIVGSNNIIIDAPFAAKVGSTLNIRTDPNVCN